jgi:hypothetical protein
MAKKKTRKRRTRVARKTRQKAVRRGRRSSLSSVSTAALQAELARRLTTLAEQRDRLVAELEALDQELGAIDTGASSPAPARRKRGRPPGSGRAGRKRAGRPARSGRRNKANLVDSLHALLQNRTLNVTEISNAVQKAGYKTKSPNFRTIVNQTLINNPKMFKRVARGQYTAK